MRCYSIFIQAFDRDGRAHTRPAVILAYNKDEAVGKAYTMAYEYYPATEYRSHLAGVVVVPDQVYNNDERYRI